MVLDVGGGHGQNAGPFIRAGYDVTVLGSSPACMERVQTFVTAGECRFQVGNIISLPFGDRLFDAVIRYRVATHVGLWENRVYPQPWKAHFRGLGLTSLFGSPVILRVVRQQQ